MTTRLSPKGQQLAFGTAGPLVGAQGQVLPATLVANSAFRETIGRFPQTDRWPLPGSGLLHPLDYIVIAGIDLPLDDMPDAGDELDVSERKAPGSDWSSFVSHGKKAAPVRIRLRLFRDQSLGYADGHVRGRDWFKAWDQLAPSLISNRLSKRNAVPVYYPTLHARGCDALIFTRASDPKRSSGQFYVVELEARDPRNVRIGSGDGSKKVGRREDIGTRANPVPPQHSTPSPSAKKRGK